MRPGLAIVVNDLELRRTHPLYSTLLADATFHELQLFVRRGGALTYRQPVDKFAQAAIIEPDVLRMPASTCRVRSVSHENDVVKITADCNDSISYTTQTAEIKVTSAGEIVYSPTGDPALVLSSAGCEPTYEGDGE